MKFSIATFKSYHKKVKIIKFDKEDNVYFNFVLQNWEELTDDHIMQSSLVYQIHVPVMMISDENMTHAHCPI